MPGVARGDDGRLYEPLRWSHRSHAGVRSGLPRGSEPAQFRRRTAGALSKACTLTASRSARTRVKINACRSLCALISRRKSWSYAEEVTVSGKPSGRGAGTANERLSIAELLATSRAESPPGLLATMAAGAEQQVARRRCPVLEAHRASLAGRELSSDARSPICGQSRSTTQIRGPAVPIASSWIGDGADRVIEEGLPSGAVVLPGSAAATDHDHRLRLRRDSELGGVEVLGLPLLGDE